MSAGEAMMILVAGILTLLFSAAAVWLHRTARMRFGGAPSPLPPARVHDGRTFRGPVIEGRNRPALVVAGFYVVVLWLLALGSLVGLIAGLAYAS